MLILTFNNIYLNNNEILNVQIIIIIYLFLCT